MFFKGLTCDPSPYTLDNPEHIKALFVQESVAPSLQ
jgi:hypothetical protein